jgi:N-acetylmuramoyl-L-alanine amidase
MGARLMGHHVTVEQGDHLPALAEEAGFSDWRTVWDAPENAELRAQRKEPGLLAPGDRVFLPDKQAGDGVRVPTGASARFRVKIRLPKLRVVVCGFDGKPLADTQVTVTVEGAEVHATTGADGLVELDLTPGAREATLEVNAMSWTLQIGHLDPVDTDTGLWARLRNLGYLVDEDTEQAGAAPDAPPDPELLAFAIELFQRDHGLPIDGSDAASVTAKLKEAYGC